MSGTDVTVPAWVLASAQSSADRTERNANHHRNPTPISVFHKETDGSWLLMPKGDTPMPGSKLMTTVQPSAKAIAALNRPKDPWAE